MDVDLHWLASRLTLLLLCCAAPAAQGAALAADTAALWAFHNTVQQSNGTLGVPGWFPKGNAAANVCDFLGVTCSASIPQRVTEVQLYNEGLTGASINALAGLSALQLLVLKGNSFRGTLSPSFGKLSQLYFLELTGNLLNGTLPDLSGAPLRRLYLGGQRSNTNSGFTGSIPSSIGAILSLKTLDLSFSSLTGSIPIGLVNLPVLEDLVLDHYLLSGVRPHLGNLSKTLITLSIGYNNYVPGPIPAELNTFERMTGTLDMSAMNLVGGLVDLSNMGATTDLLLDDNDLTGRINPLLLPQGLLGFFSAKNNRFSGPLDPSIIKTFANPLYSLADCGMILSNNRLSGPLPDTLGTLIQAYVLDFSGNRFTGGVPPSWAYIYSLGRLYLSKNRLSGSIPEDLGYARNVRLMELNGNLFTGAIPSTFARLTRLERLDISSNKLSGTIPDLSSLTNLIAVNFSRNELSGSVPSFPQAQIADLGRNYLSAVYPSAGFPARSMTKLYMNCLKRATAGCGVAGASPAQRKACRAPSQRKAAQCRRFCRADLYTSLCSGNGYCTLTSKYTSACTCNVGFKPPSNGKNKSQCVPAR